MRKLLLIVMAIVQIVAVVTAISSLNGISLSDNGFNEDDDYIEAVQS